MTVRNIKKNLAGAEDLLHGIGVEAQSRGGAFYEMHKLDTYVPTYDVAEMQKSALTFMRLYGDDTHYTDYRRNSTGTIGIPSDLGGVWEPMRSSELPVCGSFTNGAYVFSSDCIVGYNDSFMQWQGDTPKVVAAGATPATSGGVGAGAWVDRTDVTLRSEINIIQKRFACVADMVADTSLVVGQIIETIGYSDGWAGTADKPKGSNRYEIVAASTGTDDGGSFITLANGLQAKALFLDGEVSTAQFGAIGDGSDETTKLQNAINFAASTLSKLIVSSPSSKYCVRPINIPSNSNIEFESGVTVEAVLGYDLSNTTSAERLITLNNVSNVTMLCNNAVFTYNSAYVFTGEFNHCFRIIGGSNIYIEKAKAISSGGDGFFIGPVNTSDELNTSGDNIVLVDCYATTNRRNGFSVISGKRIKLIRPTSTYHPTTVLGSGIDIEPNLASTVLDVYVENPTTVGNAFAGISVVLQLVSSSSTDISVTISEHNSALDKKGFYSVGSLSTTSCTGVIRYLNPKIKLAYDASIKCFNQLINGPQIYITNPECIDGNTSATGTAQLASGIVVNADTTCTNTTDKVGGVTIDRPDIKGTATNKPVCPILFEDQRTTPLGVDRSFVNDPVRLSNTTNAYNVFGGNVTFNDSGNVLTTDIADTSIDISALKRHYGLVHNASSTTEAVFYLPSLAWYPEVEFEVRSAYYLRIKPNSTSNIVPLAPTVNKYIRSNTIGSRVRLKRISANTWMVVKLIGTWEVQA